MKGWHDPTHGRIDRDIQEQVEAMGPVNLAQRVALENTLQNKRDRLNDMMRPRPLPATCEDGWHIHRGGAKKCDCGEMRNPAYRTWWQRQVDRWKFKRMRRKSG